ncbi:S8 family serine peptidase [Bacillus sp. ISL-40]|uniref:S8 family serine peptidase n=1 Tax=unclassified Bacillus (in: firmicutes) TaxID=185979 RepID=UPI001BEA4F61|nr:S8 family serine peptidase [Bacillus sp. ISL-46]MBT2701123.1 S8 family serine peptidase [Bacillus sp. ISL-40]MBT2722804.1 S8 family serine peptidase [Bacillus sp. ISL-46]MBT2743652.1 S8 family serine peptidase [Bacillus sp. ISL-77]
MCAVSIVILQLERSERGACPVISMSLGGPDDNPELKAMIKEAIDKQIAVVVAAGNEGDSKEDRRVFVSWCIQ